MHYSPITHMADVPYGPDEIRHFARHNLYILLNGRKQDNHRHPDAVEHYAHLIESLPPAFQVILIGSSFPSVMAAPDDMENDHMGLFTQERVAGIGKNPVYWGGMFETRLRDMKNNHITPNVTFRHEQGHRIGHIMACRHIAEGRLSSKTSCLSLMPEWYEAAARQIQRSPGIRERLMDGMLYKGMRRLTEHLSLPHYQGNSPEERQHHIALESFAEMTAHYATLYHDYDRNDALVDTTLAATYPILWPLYRDAMLPLINKEALTLSNEMNNAKHGLLHTMANIASLRAEPFDPDTAKQALRRIELEGGLPGLTRHGRETYARQAIHLSPHEEYGMTVDRVDAIRQALIPGADSCTITEWEEALSHAAGTPYHALVSQGIDVEPEIHLLRQEARLLRPFIRKMHVLHGSDLAPEHGNNTWIMEDFDQLTRILGRNTGSLENIRTICEVSLTAEDFRRYAHAYGIERDLLHDGKPASEEDAGTARQRMYHNLLSGTFGTYIKAMEMYARKERDFITRTTNALPGDASTETFTLTRKQARKHFHETLRTLVAEQGFDTLFAPSNQIGPERSREKDTVHASEETLHHRIDGRSGL